MNTTLEQAKRMQAPRAIALCQNFNGVLKYQAKEWEAAEMALTESIDLFQQIGAAGGEALSRQRLGLLQTEQGRLDEALFTLEAGAAIAEQALLRAHVQVRLYASIAHNRLLANDLAAAEQALAAGQALVKDHGHCSLCESLLLPVAVRVAITQRDLVTAETYCRQLEQATTRYGSHTWLALASQAWGELAVAWKDIETAKNYYAAAQSSFHKARNEYAAAQCAAVLTQFTSPNED